MSYVLAAAGFAALIILHEAGHFAVAKAVGMRVERFALFFPPLLFKVRRGETEYGIGCIPLGGYVRISGMSPLEELPPEVAHRAYYRQVWWKRVLVIAAGPVVNLILAFLIFWALLCFRGLDSVSSKVDSIEKGSPAVGLLMKGDRLLAVDGHASDDTAVLAKQVARHKCKGGATVKGCRAVTPAKLLVLRDGRRTTVPIHPTYDPANKRMRIGFAFGIETTHQSVVHGARTSISRMWFVTKATVTAIGKLTYSEKARKDVSGPVGSYEATRETINVFGFVDALNVLAIISLSLAIVNLFPFLPLDGGHIFWAVAERIRGKAISFSVLERASWVGIMLVALIFVVGLTNDVGRLSGDGFGIQ